MNCHKCKNPIEDNATECEWCGAILIKNKPTFTVILRSVGIDKLAIVNTVREFTGLSLKDAKDKVNSVPTVIKEGCTQEEAEIIKVQLEKDGADAECFLSNEVTENKEINNSVAKKPSDWKKTCLVGCLFVLFAIFGVPVVAWIGSLVVYSDEKAGSESTEYSVFIPSTLNSTFAQLGVAYQNATQTVIVNIIEEKKNTLRHLSVSNLSSYADYLQNMLNQRITTLNHKTTQINGLSAIIYQYQFGDRYGNKAYIEMGNSYFQVIVEVPFKDRYEYQKEIDKIIYSFRRK
jgi:hypothetical protein